MKIKRIVVGVYAVNCYIVYNDEKKGFIVDPGGDYDDICKFIEQENITLEFILLTHGHADHIGAVKFLKENFNLPIYVSERERNLLKNPVINLSTTIPPFKKLQLNADVYLKDGDNINFYGENLTVMETPGHTDGSICVLMNDVIFTGDTLFRMSIGRSDLAMGNYEDIMLSLKKIYKIEGEYKILPGHGAESSLTFEKENNPFMKNMKI